MQSARVMLARSRLACLALGWVSALGCAQMQEPAAGQHERASTDNGSLNSTLSATFTATALVSGAGPLAADLSQYMPAEIDQACPMTTFEGTGSDGIAYRVSVPKFSILHPDIRDTGAVVAFGGVRYRLLTTWTIACEGRAARVILLSATPAGTATLRTYENDVRYMCAKLKDPTDSVPKWMCGTGTLGAGTPVYAQPTSLNDSDPKRVAFPRSIAWSGNTWSHHFAFIPGLGVISERIPASSRTGYTQLAAWDLNPNDTWPDGRSKAPDYVAAVAVKATTGRNGVPISVHTYNAIAGVDLTQLNDCENDGTQTYYSQPDIASTGAIEGIYVNVVAGPRLQTDCSLWTERLGIPVATPLERTTPTGSACRSFAVGPTVALRVGLNTSDTDPRRNWCPPYGRLLMQRYACSRTFSRLGGGDTESAACDDGNPCTLDCQDLRTGACTHSPIDDIAGDTDSTIEAPRGTTTTMTSHCDDGQFCNGREYCSQGACIHQTGPDCSRMTGACTIGACSETFRACVGAPRSDGTTCSDGNVCTGSDACIAGVCSSGAALASGVGACTCGNGVCDGSETRATCPTDCACGDGICGATETAATCLADCFCGDARCDASESNATCASDCPAAPAAPTGLLPSGKGYVYGRPVNLRWTATPGATSYQVTVFGATATVSTNAYAFSPPYNNRAYSWQVRACNASGCSSWSSASFVFAY